MLSNEEALNVGLIHLKNLVRELEQALALERGGGTPISVEDYLSLRKRARNFITDGVVTETLMGEATLAIVITNAFDEDEYDKPEQITD